MALIRKTKPEVIQALDVLLDTCTDTEAAQRLNAAGHRSWQQQPFTNKTVAYVRRHYGLKSCLQRLLAKGFRRGADIAKEIGVSETFIHTLGREGLLRRRRYGGAVGCLYEPLGAIAIIPGIDGKRAKRLQVINVRASTQETI